MLAHCVHPTPKQWSAESLAQCVLIMSQCTICPATHLLAVVAQFSDKCPLLLLSGLSFLVLNHERELSFTDCGNMGKELSW